MKYTMDEYNNEPVHYCSECLELNVRELSASKLFVCGECGNTKIEESHINDWIELYTKEYGKPFLSKEDLNQ